MKNAIDFYLGSDCSKLVGSGKSGGRVDAGFCGPHGEGTYSDGQKSLNEKVSFQDKRLKFASGVWLVGGWWEGSPVRGL